VVAKQDRKVNKVIEARSLEYGVPLMKEGEDFFVRVRAEGDILYKGKSVEWTLPAPGLAGQFQLRNAALALAAVERMTHLNQPPPFPDFPAAALAIGMRSVEWPARLQKLESGALAGLLPPDWELWLDGAHNPDAAEALQRHTRAWRDKPTYAVMGMLNTKDIDSFLRILAPRFKAIRGVTIPDTASAVPADQVAAKGTEHFCVDSQPAASVADALKDLAATKPGPARVMICGSLYLAGEVLKENGG
jgi:dihydrofolate synthase/folylpolyglutamate synthase